MPPLQVWEATHPLCLLDLTSTRALRDGASVGPGSVLRPTYRAWARVTQTQLPDVDDLRARSTMTEGEMTVLFSPVRNSLSTLPRDTVPPVGVTLYALLKVLTPDVGYKIV